MQLSAHLMTWKCNSLIELRELSMPFESAPPRLPRSAKASLCAPKRILKSFFTIWQWLSAHTQLINLVTRWEHSSLSYKVICRGVRRRRRFLAVFLLSGATSFKLHCIKTRFFISNTFFGFAGRATVWPENTCSGMKTPAWRQTVGRVNWWHEPQLSRKKCGPHNCPIETVFCVCAQIIAISSRNSFS